MTPSKKLSSSSSICQKIFYQLRNRVRSTRRPTSSQWWAFGSKWTPRNVSASTDLACLSAAAFSAASLASINLVFRTDVVTRNIHEFKKKSTQILEFDAPLATSAAVGKSFCTRVSGGDTPLLTLPHTGFPDPSFFKPPPPEIAAARCCGWITFPA